MPPARRPKVEKQKQHTIHGWLSKKKPTPAASLSRAAAPKKSANTLSAAVPVKRDPDELVGSSSKSSACAKPASPSVDREQRKREIEELKCFDRNKQFGPAASITRLDRWHREVRFGKTPPEHVKELVEQHPGERVYTHSFYDNMTILGGWTDEPGEEGDEIYS